MAKRKDTRPDTASQRDRLLTAILLAAIFLTYLPVWFSGFTWDDDSVLTGNPVIVGPLGLVEIWTTRAADICPLVLTTFWAEFALWGYHSLPYHLVNLALHAACAILLWRILLALRVPGAWFGAALWALHPVQVETAAWITEMKNTQSGLFYLLTILAFIRGLDARSAGNQARASWAHAATLLCAAAAMASKSSTIVLPIVLALCAWWIEGRWRWRNLFTLAPLAAMAVLPAALTLWTQKLRMQGPEDLQWARSFPERLATAGDAIWFYLGKLIWPHPLTFIYPRWRIDAASWLSYVPLAAALSTLAILWAFRATWARPLFFAYAYFLAALLPVLGLVDGFFWRYSLVGDHFQYLADMGPLALAGAALARLGAATIPGDVHRQHRVAAGVLLILGLLSWHRAWVYQDLETLWTDTLARNPSSWMAHNNLGDVYLQTERLDAAQKEYEEALRINPLAVNAHSNLGIILAREKRYDDAIAQFREALAIRPHFGRAVNNLAVTFYMEGRLDSALATWHEAERVNPYYPQIHYNLGHILLQMGHPDQAIPELEKALKIDPESVATLQDLSAAQKNLGQIDQAIVTIRKALSLQPDNADLRKNLTDLMTSHPPTQKQ